MTDVMFSSDEFDANKFDFFNEFLAKDGTINPLDLTSTANYDGDIDMGFIDNALKVEPQPGSPSAGFSDSSSSSPYSSSPEATPVHSFSPSSPACLADPMNFDLQGFSETKFISPQETLLSFEDQRLSVPESLPTFAIGTDVPKKPIQPASSSRKRNRDTMKSTNQSASPLDEEQFKRQRRLIKNRESAAKSRQRKKEYVEDLEQKVETLTARNQYLEAENKALKEDVGYLSNIIRKTPGISADVLKGLARRSSHSTNSTKAAGVCLLIVLFTFGLFFNVGNKDFGGRPALPFEIKAREVVPEVLPSHVGDTGSGTREYSSTLHQMFTKDQDLMSGGSPPGGTLEDSAQSKSPPREIFPEAGFQRTAWGKSDARGPATAAQQPRVLTG